MNNWASRSEAARLRLKLNHPVIDVDGQILADFDPDQLAEFWKRFE